MRKIDRREFLKKAAIAGTTLVGLELIGCTPAAPPPAPTATRPAASPTTAGAAATPTPSEADRVAQLVEGARKEGALQLYTVGTVEELESYRKLFSQKYPFVKVEGYTARSEDVVGKVLTEGRAGKTIADFVRTSGDSMNALVKADLLMPYESPERKFFPDIAKDKEGKMTIGNYSLHAICYNTKLVTKAEAPKSWDDLLDPKWKGKMGIEASCYEWFTYQLKLRGRDKGVEFMKKLAQQDLSLRKGHSTLLRFVVSGELHIGVMIYQDVAQREMDKGAPAQWVLVNPVTVSTVYNTLLKSAPHPNAGKLFMDWILSEEGQKIAEIQGRRTPTRTGLKPDPPSLIEGVQFYQPDPLIGDEIDKNRSLFEEIFGTI